MKTKKLLTAALAAAMVGSVGMTQVAYAAGGDVPPAGRIAKTEFDKNLTVPNSINVTLSDEDGNLLNGGAFQLLDENGGVVAEWKDNKGYISADSNRKFDDYSFNITADELYETGDYHDRIHIYHGGLYDEDSMLRPDYSDYVRYVAYGNRMTDVQTVTIPAGEVWVRVDQGYKREPNQAQSFQRIEYNGAEYDLSDLAGTTQKSSLPAGSYPMSVENHISGPLGPVGGRESCTLVASTTNDEYVPVTLDLHTYYSSFVDENGTYVMDEIPHHFGAPVFQDNRHITSAYLHITSGAVTNFVALDGSTTATIYVKKGDYVPKFSCSFAYVNDSTTKTGGGHVNESVEILEYAKHTIHLNAPPTTGANIGYLPAGTYTLHQTAAPEGYQPAADQTVTVKDSYQAADLQKISVVNTKSAEHTHTFSDVWTTDETSHWHAATCEHTDQVNDKAPHTYGEWTITQQPTTEQEGLREHKCTVCGYTQQEKLPPVDPEIPLTPLKPATPVNPDIPLTPLTPAEVVIPATPLEPGKPVEKPAKPVEPAKPAKPEAANPQTGDTGNLMLWSAAACAGLAGITLSLKKKKQQ